MIMWRTDVITKFNDSWQKHQMIHWHPLENFSCRKISLEKFQSTPHSTYYNKTCPYHIKNAYSLCHMCKLTFNIENVAVLKTHKQKYKQYV